MNSLALTIGVSSIYLYLNFNPATAANWPGWRGSNGQGVSTDKNLPTQWSETNNVHWRIELPGPGNSSPVVWGDRVFVAQAVKADKRRTLMCFDRATGKQLWQSGVTYTESEPTQQSNPYCSATPATDGERVIVSFGSAGLYSYDFMGKEIWHREFGKMTHMFGNAASPILHGDLCFLNFGPDEKARLIAVNKKTGETVWEATPPKPGPDEQPTFGGRGGPGGASGPGGGPPADFQPPPDVLERFDKNKDGKLDVEERAAMRKDFESRFAGGAGGPPGGPAGGPGGPGGGGGGPGRGRGPGGRGGGMSGGSWSTPIVINNGTRDELVAVFPNRVVAYDPGTGKQFWLSKGIGSTIYTTPLWSDGTLVAMSGGMSGASAIAVKSGGDGDVTESQRVWRLERIKGRIGSGVIHDGHIYSVNDNGMAECADLKTGKTVWEERLPAKGTKGGSWSSVLLANGRLYIPNQSGDVIVLQAAPKFEVVRVNSIGIEPTNASLAASDGELFLRTDKALWCLGSKPTL